MVISKVWSTFHVAQDRAVAAFSGAKHAEAAKADELDGLLLERGRERESRLAALDGRIEPATLTLMDLIARTLDNRIERVRRELEALTAQAEPLRAALVEATAKVKAIEALEERRGAERAQAEARAEQARLDELRPRMA